MDLSQVYSSLPMDLLGGLSLVLMAVGGMIVVVWDAFRTSSRAIPWFSTAIVGLALAWEIVNLQFQQGLIFSGLMRAGGFASFINLVILSGTFLTLLLSVSYLERIRHAYGEVYALVLFATAGMIVLGSANHLVSIFVGLETMSIALYILTGLVREDEGATEAALKYFLLGAFSTGFFLYGIALLYGATGTMYLPLMMDGLYLSGSSVMFWCGVGLFLIGFMFKVSAAPFHMWTPDVYQGAPTPLSGFMSTASKAAAFASLVLVLFYALPVERWSLVLAIIAVITMIVGNVLALAQANVKRMLAYSSIAHAGYVLVGLAAASPEGYAGALVYLLIYTLMNVGAFGVMALLEWDGKVGREQTLDSLAGVGFRRPLLGVTMGIFMFSLTGFPPLAGFFGKVLVFAPAIDAGLTWLVVIGVLASVLSAGYYLRVLWVFWMMSPAVGPEAARVRSEAFAVPVASAIVLVACAGLLVVLGFVPALYETAGTFFVEGAMAFAP